MFTWYFCPKGIKRILTHRFHRAKEHNVKAIKNTITKNKQENAINYDKQLTILALLKCNGYINLDLFTLSHGRS